MNKRLLLIITILVGMALLLGNSVVFVLPETKAATTEDTFVYLPLIRNDAAPPVIDFFISDVDITDPGTTIELQWQTSNAVTTTLYHMMQTGQFGTFWTVTSDGSMTYEIHPDTRNYERFMLYASNEAGDFVSETVTITLNCPYPWFFAPAPNICAQGSGADTAGAEQQFEHGTMIWVESEDRIYVLFDDDQFSPKWASFSDDWSDGMPINDPNLTPPSGMVQPERGFGLVWREEQTIRDRLGWALVPEAGFVTAVQHTSYPKYNEIYIRAHDSNIWYLKAERSAWEKFTPN